MLGGEVKDPYDALGLDPDASLDEIRVAYRQLARQFHPDRFVDAAPETQHAANERMQEINHALAVLTNPAELRRFERQRRLQERRDAAYQRQSGQAAEGANATTGARDRVRFTSRTTDSGRTSSNGETSDNRAWRGDPPPANLKVREFSGWGDAHWVFVYGPGGRAGRMNVTTGEVTIEREELRDDVLRLLQHYAFDSWS